MSEPAFDSDPVLDSDPVFEPAKTPQGLGLVAVDFDGTIADHNGHVSVRTVRVLAEAVAQGWLLVGATGRPVSLCAPVIEQVSAMGYLVAGNGAEVFRIDPLEPLFSTEITARDARAVIAAIRCRWPTVGFCLGRVDGTQQWERGFEEVVPIAPVGDAVGDVIEALSGPVRSLMIFGDSIVTLGPDASLVLDDVVADVAPNVGVADSGLGIPEARPRHVSKAWALEQLRRHLGIGPSRTIAFGDGANDREMLRWAYRGVAMGDADPTTILAADETTGPITADGVAVWLERHVLGA